MSRRAMSRRAAPVRLALALGVLVLGRLSHAQDNLPIPYSDAPAEHPAPPSQAAPQGPPNRGTELGAVDDPAVGVGLEAIFGVMLVDSARALPFGDLRFAWGGRYAWDWGRRLTDPVLHEALFLDLTFVSATVQDGTAAVNTSTTFSNVTIAPAYEIPFGEGSPFGAYAQVGAGVSFIGSTLNAGTTRHLNGIEPLLQYGIGIRGRPLLTGEGLLRFTFRVELTRFRRAYMDDTLALGSVGLAF